MLKNRAVWIRWLCFSALLLLAACAEARLASHTVKSIGGTGDTGQVGRYKIGKPYQVSGVWYYPKENFNYSETGIASWYGPGFHGKSTANGERYDQNALTAAHRTLPLPSMVRVTNLDNGRALTLRINDRGPFAHGRIIDVSKRAAQLLDFERAGTAKVKVEILEDESRQLAIAAGSGKSGGKTPPAVPRVAVASQSLDGQTSNGGSSAASGQTQSAARQVPVPQPDGRVTQRAVRPSSIYLQAGAFLEAKNAVRLRAELAGLAKSTVTRARVGKQSFYRVRLGPIASVEDADRLLALLISNGHNDARVIID